MIDRYWEEVYYSRRCLHASALEIVNIIFAHGCDVTSMSLAGSLMALTHSILINLFIKVELNTFFTYLPC